MSKITELASGQLNRLGTIIVELIEADETPAVVIIRWPSKPTVIHPHHFPGDSRAPWCLDRSGRGQRGAEFLHRPQYARRRTPTRARTRLPLGFGHRRHLKLACCGPSSRGRCPSWPSH